MRSVFFSVLCRQIHNQDTPQMLPTPATLTFDVGIDMEAKTLVTKMYNFQSSSQNDVTVASELLAAVKSHYVEHEGISMPRHLQPSARQHGEDIDPETSSDIFVLPYNDIEKLSTKELREIHEERHILVINKPLPSEEVEFNEDSLSSIGAIGIPRTVHGASFPCIQDLPLNNVFRHLTAHT